MKSIEEIRALCEAATPGPWNWETWQAGISCATGWIGTVDHDPKGDGPPFADLDADGEFIAASRTLVSEMLDEIERLEADLTQVRSGITKVINDMWKGY